MTHNIQPNNGQKYKVLMLSDHPLAPSGVGIQSNILIQGLLKTGKYQFRCFGGAIKHGDYRTIQVEPFGEDYIIAPVDGFGDPMRLRLALTTEKPDALLLFTDPRFFIWVYEMEDEIHDVCPIVYNHIWDEEPYPKFNAPFYEATDLINCISWKTYSLVHPNFPEKTNYIPHALPQTLFYQLPDDEILQYKTQIFGEDKRDWFIGLWVNRNAKRKRPGDLLDSWSRFLNELEKKHGHKKALLVMHTDPLDNEGPNLYKQIEYFNLENNVYLSKDKLDFQKMNVLHNVSDFCINVSNAEGFGLATLEAMYTGTPIIASKTGGLTTQVVNPESGEEYGIGLDIDVRTLVGSQIVPYIYEDHVNNDHIAVALMKMYEWGPEERKRIGQRAKEYALHAFNIDDLIKAWDMTLEATILQNRKNKAEKKRRFTLDTF